MSAAHRMSMMGDMNTPKNHSIVRVAALSLTGALAIAACGGDGGSGGGAIDLSDGLASADVCNGNPSDVNPPASDPFSGYTYLNDGTGWTTGFDVFGDQRAIVGDDATAIMCVNVTETAAVERCEYDEDGEAFTLVMNEATYTLDLRNADTANVIATHTVTVPAEECPFVTSWTEGEGERNSYPTPSEEQIEVAIGPFLD